MIYLDYNATTPCAPEVLAAMLPYFSESFANPANVLHAAGRQALSAVGVAREQVAALVGASSDGVIFTGGATESDNLAILGLARRALATSVQRRRIVTTVVEHKAVLEPCRKLAELGFEVIELPVDANGIVRLEAAREAITPETLLVSVQAANNETGVLQPLAQLSALARAAGALMHSDAAQAAGKVRLSLADDGLDFVSLSAHKMYGPKGIGALVIRRRGLRGALEPLTYGGGQEWGLRPGTLNVPGIIGFGAAASLTGADLSAEGERQTRLRDRLEAILLDTIPGLGVNGGQAARLPGTTNMSFPDREGDELLLALPELCAAQGSACSSGTVAPSHVLIAMGLSAPAARRSIRLSVGRPTRIEDIERAASMVANVCKASC